MLKNLKRLQKVLLISFIALSTICKGQNEKAPYVLLISLDGFRADYIDKYDLPNLRAFIAGGASAEYMLPSFPSLTFPNHYSIITGMYPGHHGLVDNRFWDSKRQVGYSMGTKELVVDSYFYGGTPLWLLARQGGLKTASYYWVGSELSDATRDPDYYYPYVDTVSFKTRINQVFNWLKLPEKERPHFITLYFSSPDHESHNNGPWGEETHQALLKMDALIGDLMRRFRELPLPVNVIIISDHGMSEVKVESASYLFMDELLDLNKSTVKISGGGAQIHVYVYPKSKIDSVYSVLKKQEKNYTAYRQSDFPEAWHYRNERVGDILVTAAPNHIMRRDSREAYLKAAKIGTVRGEHGFDPTKNQDMRAIFYANGPNIKRGTKVPPFQNVDIYPFIAMILHLTPPPDIDGKINSLKKIYKK